MMEILDRLFGPLARLLVARGVLFGDLVERMKAHYVQAAHALAGDKATDSRLSVMTGLQRRDVVRLKDFAPKEQRPNHLVRLIALWQTDPDYAQEGRPRALPRQGPAPSFEALARDVLKDIHPRTMLDALVATGTVSLEGDTVHLAKSSYQPLAGSEEQIAYLTNNLGDHMSAATENVLGQAPPHFERAVHYTDLTAEEVAELAADYREGQMALFEALSRKAAAMKKLPRDGAGHRFRAGGYFYRTCEGDE
jgi:hypothetical protein